MNESKRTVYIFHLYLHFCVIVSEKIFYLQLYDI